jgi:DNA-binding transcriptional LysR family regulator
MLNINELRTFVSIVRAGSLSAAALEMDLALSVVSKRLASLERHGVRGLRNRPGLRRRLPFRAWSIVHAAVAQ